MQPPPHFLPHSLPQIDLRAFLIAYNENEIEIKLATTIFSNTDTRIECDRYRKSSNTSLKLFVN